MFRLLTTRGTTQSQHGTVHGGFYLLCRTRPGESYCIIANKHTCALVKSQGSAQRGRTGLSNGGF